MSAPRTAAPNTHGQRSHGEDPLIFARGILADIAHHKDSTIAVACQTIRDSKKAGPEEKARARDLHHLVLGEYNA